MKRFTSFSLLLLYLISFTEFCEMLRLPLMAQHFVEHKSKATNLTFIEFLELHYKTDTAHDDQDMSLPFKTCNHSINTPIVLLNIQKFLLNEKTEKVLTAQTSFYLQHEPQLLAGDIFQPPKI